MATYMPDDGLGEWTEEEIHGAHVEWRCRDSRAEEAHFGTQTVVDISVNGAPPQTFADFAESVSFHDMLEYSVSQMI